MEENIIGFIVETESEAAARKAQAQTRAAEIVAAAEKRSAEIIKQSEAECKTYREQALAAAEQKASAEYEKTIADSREEAVIYANSLLAEAEPYVNEIVGRLIK